MNLCDGAFDRKSFHSFEFGFGFFHSFGDVGIDPIFDVLTSSVAKRFGDISSCSHFCKFGFHGAKSIDAYAKLLALCGVIDRMGNDCSNSSKYTCAQFHSADVENVDRDFEAVLSIRKHVFDRYWAIVEKYLTGRGAFDTHFFLFLIHGDSTKSLFYDECSEVFIIFNFGKDDEKICKTSV